MALLFGRAWSRSELRAHVGDLVQVAGIRLTEWSDGVEQGPGVAAVRTGSGLRALAETAVTSCGLFSCYSAPDLVYAIYLKASPDQIKVREMEAPCFRADGVYWANEQLGYAGRWWVSKIDRATRSNVDARNSTDSEYEYWRDRDFTDDVYDYVFEGYLLFDYFVTDAAGSATLSFALDSSFHVLWKTSQRTPQSTDSTPMSHTVVASSDSSWYDQSHPDTDVSIYAEWEPGRALPGQCALPVGPYNARMFITEESFHETADGSGVWATVLVQGNLTFLVGAPPPGRPDIYGRITHVSTGSGVSGVTIDLQKRDGRKWASVATATTDSQGSYVFLSLPLAAYMITPSSKEWTFNPASCTVTIASETDDVQCDFAATPRAKHGRK